MRSHLTKPTAYDVKLLHHVGFEEMFKRYARDCGAVKYV